MDPGFPLSAQEEDSFFLLSKERTVRNFPLLLGRCLQEVYFLFSFCDSFGGQDIAGPWFLSLFLLGFLLPPLRPFA